MLDYLLKKGFYLHFMLVMAFGIMMADLLLVFYRSSFLPQNLPIFVKKTIKLKPSTFFYHDLQKTNWFLASGVMPEPLQREDKEQEIASDPSQATLTSLSVKLIGTIVHVNPSKSVATFDVGGQILAGKESEELAKKFQIYFIERGKVLFLNLEKRTYEYVELEKQESSKFLGFRPQQKPVISKEDSTFNLKRSEISKLTADLPNLLKEAAMKPRRGETGKVEGFCFSWIKSSSIFRKLGFKVKDCILEVNGEDINNPQKALQIYNELKNAKNLEISVLRDGQTNTFKYNIE